MSDQAFTLDDCPTPYQPFMAGAQLPEINLTIPLEPGEDLTGAVIQMILTRDTSDPDNPDIIEKTLTLVEHVAGKHWAGKVEWAATDLIEGSGQQALFILKLAGEPEPVARFVIDVFENTDPTP